jgi:hypothetical protein
MLFLSRINSILNVYYNIYVFPINNQSRVHLNIIIITRKQFDS